MFKILLAVLTGGLLLLSACTKDPGRPSLTVSNEVLNPVNRHLFGHFIEKCSWGGEIGGDLVVNSYTGTFDSLVLEQLKALHIPNLRYPGGTDVDYYDWTELVDNAPGQSRRKPYREYQKGMEGRVVSDNRLGLNEFLELCEILEAEPILVVNLGDAFHNKKSIQEAKASAADLLAYCTMEAGKGNPWADYRKQNGREHPYRVNYVEIGNEYWGFEGLNWIRGYDSTHIRHLYTCIEALADTLLSLDPRLNIIVDGPLPELNDLMEAHMKDKISHLVFHTYVPWGIHRIYGANNEEVDPEQLSPEMIWKAWVATPAIDPFTGLSMLPGGQYHRAPFESGFQLAATEWNWNGWFEGGLQKAGLPQPDLAKAVGAAGFLHAMMRQGKRVELACQSMTVGQSWGISGIRVDPDYEQASVFLPTAQVTGLYSRYHGTELLHSETADIPGYEQALRMNGIAPEKFVASLDILATRSSDKLYIHVINRSYQDPHELQLRLNGLRVARTFTRHTLEGDPTARITNKALKQAAEISGISFNQKGRSMVLKVPAASVSVFEFELLDK